jgi:hypothetical protein
MYITIIDCGRPIKAKVIYNFKQVNDVILLKLEMPLKTGERDIMFFLKNNTWTDDTKMKEKAPEVFEQIEGRLKNVFMEAVNTINKP